MTRHEAYDRLAPHYRVFAAARTTYIDAVNRYIVEHAPPNARMLDVGAGDGVRAAGIAECIGAARIVLCEPSAAMARLCRSQRVDEVWTVEAQALPATDERFEVITCLWNVLGHLPDRASRSGALAAMRRLLAPAGRIFCDVNNRHNARAYGGARVLVRRLIDGVVPDDRRGDSEFAWDIGGERIPARGHLFTPEEMSEIITSADLIVEERIAVDYLTGERSSSPRAGQLLYRLRARAVQDREEAR